MILPLQKNFGKIVWIFPGFNCKRHIKILRMLWIIIFRRLFLYRITLRSNWKIKWFCLNVMTSFSSNWSDLFVIEGILWLPGDILVRTSMYTGSGCTYAIKIVHLVIWLHKSTDIQKFSGILVVLTFCCWNAQVVQIKFVDELISLD